MSDEIVVGDMLTFRTESRQGDFYGYKRVEFDLPTEKLDDAIHSVPGHPDQELKSVMMKEFESFIDKELAIICRKHRLKS